MSRIGWLRRCYRAWAGAIESSHREKQETRAMNEALFAGWRERRFEYWRPMIEKPKEEKTT